MEQIRRSNERGYADHGWLKSFHSFSFADYYDPKNMGFGPLRVINDDRIAPGTGFGMHGHRDMEILTYVMAGELTHRDSMGHGAALRAGDVQRMSAGTGIMHCEFNNGREAEVHLLQIWIEPKTRGIRPSYEDRSVPAEARRGRLALIAAPEGEEALVHIHQDARLYAGLFDGREQASVSLAPGRRGYVHLARGAASVNGQALSAGDALALEGVTEIRIDEGRDADVLVFDLPQ